MLALNTNNYKPLVQILIVITGLIFTLTVFTVGCGENQGNANSASGSASDVDLHEVKPEITIDLPGLPAGSTKLEMALIKPGTYMMGSSIDDSNRSKKEWPVHEVTLSKPFYIGKFEITQAQWESVMGEKSHHSKFRGMNRPVDKISWLNCQLFLRKLNKLGIGQFRLPSEAEWEYACRAGSDMQFSFASEGENQGVSVDRYMWWRGNNSVNSTKDVGTKKPNTWGIYDMHGNVSEWCSDHWVQVFERLPFVDEPSKPSLWTLLQPLRRRVFKGGSFNGVMNECRAASRNFEQSVDYHYTIGLRIVREMQ